MGSLLYDVGGFDLPFYIFGAAGVLLAFVTAFLVPSVKVSMRDDDDGADTDAATPGSSSDGPSGNRKQFSLVSVLKVR